MQATRQRACLAFCRGVPEIFRIFSVASEGRRDFLPPVVCRNASSPPSSDLELDPFASDTLESYVYIGSAGLHTDQRVNASERLKVYMSRKPRWEHVSAGFACCSRVPAKPSMFIQGVSRAVGRAACGSTNRSAPLASREITALLVSVS